MSTQRFEPGLVVGDGTVTGRWGVPGPFGVAWLPIDGDGVVGVDPVELQVLQVEVAEPSYAAPTLRRLVGEANLAALQLVRDDWSAQPDVGTLKRLDPGDPLLGLAFALWWRQWTPLPVSLDRASLDVGLAAWRADRPGVAADAFILAADQAHATDQWLGGRQVIPPALHRELAAAAEAAVAVLGDRHPDAAAYQGLRQALEQVDAVDVDVELATFDPDTLLPALAATHLGAGPGAQDDLPDFDLDWYRLPARVFDPRQWYLRLRRERDQLALEIDAHPLLEPRDADDVAAQATLLDVDTGAPITASPLAYDRDGHRFTAQLPDITADGGVTAAGFTLDVSAPGAAEAPAWDDAETVRRRATRAAVTALAHARRQTAATALGVDEPAALTWLLDTPGEITDLAGDDPDLRARYLSWARARADGADQHPAPLVSEMLLLLDPEARSGD